MGKLKGKMPKNDEKILEIGTILSQRTKQGIVELKIDDQVIAQWDVAKAKEIHRMLGECIEAAITDQLIYDFFTKKVGFDDNKASRVLLDFRELRQGSRNPVFPQ